MNKKMLLAAAGVLTAIFIVSPISAYAGGPAGDVSFNEPEDVKEVKPTPKREGPLTPDGNMTLVDDYGVSVKSGKQFITVTTRDGNYFYIIIDRDDKGEETVHFLNQVDESDLLSLMDDEEVGMYIKLMNDKEPDKKEEVKEEEPKKEEPEPVKEEPKKKSHKGFIIFVFILTLFSSGAYVYLNVIKPKQDERKDDDDRSYDDDDEDYLEAIGAGETSVSAECEDSDQTSQSSQEEDINITEEEE